MKDVVIRGGENVYCAEVEAVLHEHPAVAEVAIVGLDERAMGERVCAVVVPRPGADVDLADLRAFAAARLAGFKCPEALYVTDELPKTATGKVAKATVRSQVADAAGDVERGLVTAVTRSDGAATRSPFGSFGRPRTFSATVFRTISSVPPPIRAPGVERTNSVHANEPHSPVSAARRGPRTSVSIRTSSALCRHECSFSTDISGPGVTPGRSDARQRPISSCLTRSPMNSCASRCRCSRVGPVAEGVDDPDEPLEGPDAAARRRRPRGDRPLVAERGEDHPEAGVDARPPGASRGRARR